MAKAPVITLKKQAIEIDYPPLFEREDSAHCRDFLLRGFELEEVTSVEIDQERGLALVHVHPRLRSLAGVLERFASKLAEDRAAAGALLPCPYFILQRRDGRVVYARQPATATGPRRWIYMGLGVAFFGLSIMCALLRRICFVGANPTRPTFAPAGSTRGGSGGNERAEALREKVSLGDQRAMRAVTRVNTEQASKCRCGSRPTIMPGKAVVFGEESETGTQRFHRGSGGSTHGRDQMGNKGSPRGFPAAPGNGDPVRDRAGLRGWRMGA
ncbi:hypothetical protein ABZN20_15835 [Methylococcus sp. ANG]|uniref:hypothetical protein n=1 Tax=Methylococcus sp. ANG TaxID=3231903 RepID=UPI00345B1DD1